MPDPSNPVAPNTPPPANLAATATPSPQMTQSLGAVNNIPNTPGGIVAGATNPISMNQNQFTAAQILNQQNLAGIVGQQANQQAQYQQDIAQINQEAARQDAVAQAKQQEALQRSMNDAQTRDDRIRSMVADQYQKDVDPNRFWNSKSTAGKIESVIGIMLGGLGMGIAHRPGENPAMNVLNTQIQNDIDAQKTNIEKNFKAISEMHGLDQDQYNRDLHNQAWQNNFRTAALERTKLELASRAALSNSADVKANAQKALNDIQMEQDKIRYNNYMLGQQAQQRALAQDREQMKTAGTRIQELVKEKGVSPQQAAIEVYSSPEFENLINKNYAPPIVRQHQEALQYLNKMPQLLRKLYPGMSQEEIDQRIENSPQNKLVKQYQQILKEPVVPQEKPKDEGLAKAPQAQAELGENLDRLHDFMKKYKTISPSFIQGTPGTEERANRQALQQEYESFVREAGAQIYKARTGGVEPKNENMVESIIAPYLPSGSWEDEDVTLGRMQNLWTDLANANISTTRQPPPPLPNDIVTSPSGNVKQASESGYQTVPAAKSPRQIREGGKIGKEGVPQE